MTDTLTADDIAKLEELLSNAMQGDDQNEWWLDESDIQPWGVGKGPGGYRSSAPVCSSANSEDAELIVRLRNAAPELIAMAKRTQALESAWLKVQEAAEFAIKRAEKAEARILELEAALLSGEKEHG